MSFMCGSRKYPSPHRRDWREVSKTQTFTGKAMHEAKLEYSRGVGRGSGANPFPGEY